MYSFQEDCASCSNSDHLRKETSATPLRRSSLLQVSPAGMRTTDFLASPLNFPKPVLLRLVSLEASRLSKTNRLKVITLQEISAAVTLVQRRIRTRAAA